MKKLHYHKISTILDNEFKNNIKNSSRVSQQGSLNELLDFVQLINTWENVVGTKLSEHTAPLKIKHRTLIVLTDHPAYSQELSFLGPQIIKKIITLLPEMKKLITNISFQLNQQHFKTRKKQIELINEKRSTAQAITYHQFDPKVIALKKRADEMFQDIEDLEVKEHLISIFLQLNYSNN